MSQKASAADEVSTLCNHHIEFGSQQGPWLRSGDHGGTCDVQSFHGLQDPSVCPAPTPWPVHLGGGDGLSLCNTRTSSRFWPTSFNMFKWGLFMKYGHFHYYMAWTLSSCTVRSYCVFPFFTGSACLLPGVLCLNLLSLRKHLYSRALGRPNSLSKAPLHGSGEVHCAVCSVRCEPALPWWHPLTASLLPGDSCRPATGLDLFVWERFYIKSGANTLRIAPIHPCLDFRSNLFWTPPCTHSSLS